MFSHSKTIPQQKCLEEILPNLTHAIERALTDPQEWKSAECRICELLRIACEIKIAGIHAYQDEAKQWSKCIGWATKIIDTIRGISYLAKMAKKLHRKIAHWQIGESNDQVATLAKEVEAQYAEATTYAISYLSKLRAYILAPSSEGYHPVEKMHRSDSLHKSNKRSLVNSQKEIYYLNYVGFSVFQLESSLQEISKFADAIIHVVRRAKSLIKSRTHESLRTPISPARLETPTSPAKREIPKSPIKLGTPTSPTKLGTPTSPTKLGTPTSPIKLGTPKSPTKLGTPTSPAKRETPKSPIKLGTPKSLAKLETSKPWSELKSTKSWRKVLTIISDLSTKLSDVDKKAENLVKLIDKARPQNSEQKVSPKKWSRFEIWGRIDCVARNFLYLLAPVKSTAELLHQYANEETVGDEQTAYFIGRLDVLIEKLYKETAADLFTVHQEIRGITG
jgi:hypothetical protein